MRTTFTNKKLSEVTHHNDTVLYWSCSDCLSMSESHKKVPVVREEAINIILEKKLQQKDVGVNNVWLPYRTEKRRNAEAGARGSLRWIRRIVGTDARLARRNRERRGMWELRRCDSTVRRPTCCNAPGKGDQHAATRVPPVPRNCTTKNRVKYVNEWWTRVASFYPRIVLQSGSRSTWAKDVTCRVLSRPSDPWTSTDAPVETNKKYNF